MKKKLLLISIITIVLVMSLVLFLPDKMIIKSTGTLAFENHVVLAAQAGGTFSNGEPLPQPLEPILSRGGLPIVSITYADPGNSDYIDALTVIFDGIPAIHIPKSEFSLKPGETTKADVEARLNATIQKFLEIKVPLSSFPEDDPVRNGVLLDNESIERVLDNGKIERIQGKDIESLQETETEQVQGTDNETAQETEIEQVQVTDNETAQPPETEQAQVTDNETAQGEEKDNKGIEQARGNEKDNLVIALGYGAVHIYSLTPLQFITQFNGLDAGPVTGEWWQ